MVITRYLVIGGHIITRNLMDSNEIQPEILHSTQMAWQQLSQGIEEVPLQIKNRLIAVGLSWGSNLLTHPPCNQDYYPTDDSILTQVYAEAKRVSYYIRVDNKMALFRVVPETTTEKNSGLYGAIVGSHAAIVVRLPESFNQGTSLDEERTRAWEVEAEIRHSRPAYLCFNHDIPHEVFDFADSFAVTMLQNSIE